MFLLATFSICTSCQIHYSCQKKCNECDLLGNPIQWSKNTNSPYIGIIQYDSLFLFSRRDIIQLMNNCLGNASDFYNKPLHIKNPYNNVLFCNADLYNLYYFILQGSLPISPLIHGYYNTRFQIHLFEKQYTYILREHAIVNFVHNTTQDDFFEYMDEMIEEYNEFCSINKQIYISDKYDTKTMILEMKPFLLTYLQSNYSLREGRQNLRMNWYRQFSIFIENHFLPLFENKNIDQDLINKDVGEPISVI